jgi:hypothetical protein
MDSMKTFLRHSNPHIRIRLLNILLAFLSKSSDPNEFLRSKNLIEIITNVSNEDNSNLVKNIASKLLSSSGEISK